MTVYYVHQLTIISFTIIIILSSLVTAEKPKSKQPPSSENLELCLKLLAGNNASESAIKECEEVQRLQFRHDMKRGKQAVYMRKLWRAFSKEKDNPGSTSHIAHGRRPYAIDMETKTIDFNRCSSEKHGKNDRSHYDGNLTRVELVVPHNYTSTDEADDRGKSFITIKVNKSIIVEPGEATILVKGTLTFDLTFLFANECNDCCQNVTVTFQPEPGVKAHIDKAFLYEYYNLDEDILTTFRNMTRRTRGKGKPSRDTGSRLPAKRRKRHAPECRPRSLYVDLLNDITIGSIFNPRWINIRICEGMCSNSPDMFGSTLYNTGHAVMMKNLEDSSKNCNDGDLVTCVPDKMSAASLQYVFDTYDIVTKTFPAVSIKTCRCV